MFTPPPKAKLLPLYGTAALLFLGATSNAAFNVFADFEEGYVLGGGLHGQQGWVVQGGSAVPKIIADPLDSLNQVASLASAGNISIPLPSGISNTGIGTLFFRLNAPSAANFNIGATNVLPGSLTDNYESFRSQFRVGNNTNPINATELDVRSSTAFTGGKTTLGGDNTAAYTPNTWFNVWLVIDNSIDQTKFYISTDDEDAPAEPFAIGSFRAATTSPISTFYARTGTNNAVLLDDIYFDASGANLVNPIPEPATTGLVLLGLAGLAGRRRAFHG